MNLSVENGMRVQRAINAISSNGYSSLTVKQVAGVTNVAFEGVELLTYAGAKSKVRVITELKSLQASHHLSIHKMMVEKLAGTLTIPDGHHFSPSYCTMLGGISRHQSTYVTHIPQEQPRPDSLRAEFRVFMDSPRAIFFMDYGPQFAFQNINLVPSGQSHKQAESYEALFDDLADFFNKLLEQIPAAILALEQRRQTTAA